MKDVLAFAAAALPWVIMGICVIVLLVNRKKLSNADPDEEVEMDYGTEGMCLGMCFGTALESSLHGSLGIGMSLGMLVGLVLGQAIKKKN